VERQSVERAKLEGGATLYALTLHGKRAEDQRYFCAIPKASAGAEAAISIQPTHFLFDLISEQ
jgi:hypothetical protein